jgi:hypothetical protein
MLNITFSHLKLVSPPGAVFVEGGDVIIDLSLLTGGQVSMATTITLSVAAFESLISAGQASEELTFHQLAEFLPPGSFVIRA